MLTGFIFIDFWEKQKFHKKWVVLRVFWDHDWKKKLFVGMADFDLLSFDVKCNGTFCYVFDKICLFTSFPTV